MQGGYNPQGGYGAPGQQQPSGYGQPPGAGYGQPPTAAALAPMPGPPPPTEKKGFFAGLFDFSFNTFVTPTLIKIIYGISLAAIALGSIALILSGFIGGGILGGLAAMVVVPILAFLYLLMARVYTESMVVLFKVAENLQEINRKTRE